MTKITVKTNKQTLNYLQSIMYDHHDDDDDYYGSYFIWIDWIHFDSFMANMFEIYHYMVAIDSRSKQASNQKKNI